MSNCHIIQKFKKRVLMNHSNNPLHGVKLADIIDKLVEHYGWEELGKKIRINCFNNNPHKKAALKFLRNVDHEWARIKVEDLYINTFCKK
ncbi:MAG: DUF2132 multi-domain protein [uncultured Sulfurovum sp.]|uniref:DUF2132 multi-domain protein n=1 Tax=uncultured Sulfurovum sp. TaxID=269237 RepID=A0A6S6SQ29_9BACT|nr:MAG: DUF2132 multi-domain protein [uncultured Sulfurovum sp.]